MKKILDIFFTSVINTIVIFGVLFLVLSNEVDKEEEAKKEEIEDFYKKASYEAKIFVKACGIQKGYSIYECKQRAYELYGSEPKVEETQFIDYCKTDSPDYESCLRKSMDHSILGGVNLLNFNTNTDNNDE